MNAQDLYYDIEELKQKIDCILKAQNTSIRQENGWISKEEAMALLDCSERTLQNLRDCGALPYTRPFGGSKFLYKIGDINNLLESKYTGKVNK
ncbi:MAG: helix-turn-helix domain-containing protein [Bacteroidales bacterium]|nr:helix-turn-helix domain-containing protein [Bacteroidales bacterium]